MTRVVVTGAAGMLGRAVAERFATRHEVVPLSRADVDLADARRAVEWIVAQAPDHVVHCAAWTDVDGCEADPERAFVQNGLVTRNVAVAAERCGATLCYVSTDYVFDGRKKEPYREYDRPNPLGVYGSSKLWGENIVQRASSRWWIARTSWLFGPGGRNFVRTMAGLLQSRDSVRVVDDQRGCPTYTGDLAAALLDLVDSALYGVYHVTNAGDCTWFDLARQIAASLGSGCRIEPCSSEEMARPAPRPANSVLEPWAWRHSGLEPLRQASDALKEYVHSLASAGT